uniref:Uncharacterized protein n=1 Tax=Nelumbo nucifera TaxID=4432 RepID=A0A822Z321_NELNU|nr:TPA_asm: hypothetical protein HUJ06_008027 [Nelumbo nucifera]
MDSDNFWLCLYERSLKENRISTLGQLINRCRKYFEILNGQDDCCQGMVVSAYGKDEGKMIIIIIVDIVVTAITITTAITAIFDIMEYGHII